MDVFICDCCAVEMKRVPTPRTCFRCAGIEKQYKTWVDGQHIELSKKLEEMKLDWMRRHGARHIQSPPSQGADAVPPSHSGNIPPSQPCGGDSSSTENLN